MNKRILSMFTVLVLSGCADAVDEGGEENEASYAAAVTGTACTSPSADDTAALTKINSIRTALGMDAINCNNNIRTAAQKHGAYQGANGLVTHVEVSGKPGFYATSYSSRMVKAGFTGTPMTEVISSGNDPVRSLDSWMNMVWHRVPFVSFETKYFGFGNYVAGTTKKYNTIDFGSGGPTTGSHGRWPANLATGVTRTFDCSKEGDGSGASPCMGIVGYPISLTVGCSAGIAPNTVSVTKFRNVGTTTNIPFTVKTSAVDAYIPSNQIYVIPTNSLAASTKYEVEISGGCITTTQVSDWFLTLPWSFTTGAI